MLVVEGIEKRFAGPDGGVLTVLDGIDFTVETGSFTTIMGPSGCGKSTLLNILA
ncbi:MAG: ATP-binding cassette domain-containing protein, partial [Halobacteriales archaeon]|nr:ATP-binding cassette domain-containing protein [Halobacteriales archaeon]